MRNVSYFKEERGAPGRGLKVVRAFTNSPQTLSESKFAKIQISHFQGGGFMETSFQLLMLSPNLLKSKVSIWGGGGGGWWKPIFNF